MSDDNTDQQLWRRPRERTAPPIMGAPRSGAARRAGRRVGSSASGGTSADRGGEAGSGVGGARIGTLRDIAPVPSASRGHGHGHEGGRGGGQAGVGAGGARHSEDDDDDDDEDDSGDDDRPLGERERSYSCGRLQSGRSHPSSRGGRYGCFWGFEEVKAEAKKGAQVRARAPLMPTKESTPLRLFAARGRGRRCCLGSGAVAAFRPRSRRTIEASFLLAFEFERCVSSFEADVSSFVLLSPLEPCFSPPSVAPRAAFARESSVSSFVSFRFGLPMLGMNGPRSFSAARDRAKGNGFFREVSISDSESLLLFEEKAKKLIV
ncbi:hypothetical protein B0H13DRAFT_2329240 [Mycena leptocephala]|nr:hypothetical protein B0H13DRAFT_2329240 [Mycena leptocephala]